MERHQLLRTEGISVVRRVGLDRTLEPADHAGWVPPAIAASSAPQCIGENPAGRDGGDRGVRLGSEPAAEIAADLQDVFRQPPSGAQLSARKAFLVCIPRRGTSQIRATAAPSVFSGTLRACGNLEFDVLRPGGRRRGWQRDEFAFPRSRADNREPSIFGYGAEVDACRLSASLRKLRMPSDESDTSVPRKYALVESDSHRATAADLLNLPRGARRSSASRVKLLETNSGNLASIALNAPGRPHIGVP